MTSHRLVFSPYWFLLVLSFHIPPSFGDAGAVRRAWKAACVDPLVRVHAKLRPEPPRVLDDAAQGGVRVTLAAPEFNDEQRFNTLVNHWRHARLKGFDELQRSSVNAYTYHIGSESLQGHPRDENLERVKYLPALKHSVVGVVGEIHRLESELLNLAVAGWLPRREAFRLDHLGQYYGDAVLAAEWDFLHALSPAFVRTEVERIQRLRLPRKDLRFIKTLLRAPYQSRRAYLSAQKYGFFSNGRDIQWTLTDAPQNATVDANRVALRALYNEWVEVDESVRRIHARAAKLRLLAQMDGSRAAIASLEPVREGHDLRREALKDEWDVLKGWSERRRESALTMLDLFTIDRKVKRRLRVAIESSTGTREDFLRQAANKRRLTHAWTE